MSAFPATQVGVSCPDCAWTFTGEPDQALYELRAHGLEHDAAPAKPPPETAEPVRTAGSLLPAGGKTITEIANEERAILLGKTITVRCFDCPDLEWTGTSHEARLRWAEHRRDEHDDSSAMASIERMDRKVTTRDLQRMQTGKRTVEENAAKTRRSGGGHVVAEDPERPTATARRPSGYWTRERILEAFRAFHAEHGRPPRQPELRAPLLPAQVVVAREFGGLRKAVEAAGLAAAAPPPTPKPKGHSGGQKPTPIAPKPSPAHASQGTPEGTLVELAQAVEAADEEWGDAIRAQEEAQARYELAKERLTAAIALLTERVKAA